MHHFDPVDGPLAVGLLPKRIKKLFAAKDVTVKSLPSGDTIIMVNGPLTKELKDALEIITTKKYFPIEPE